MSKKIAILDYGIGNIKSISNALIKVGGNPLVTRDAEEILNSNALIIPGVGSFNQGMKNIEKFGLDKVIKDFVSTGKPVFGICLGMQILMDVGTEHGSTKGLGLIPGEVKIMSVSDRQKNRLPHIMWNKINLIQTSEFFDGMNGKFFYFVHSFAVVPENEENLIATTQYGDCNFCSIVNYKNITGVQFHPEKSGEDGLKILKRIVNI